MQNLKSNFSGQSIDNKYIGTIKDKVFFSLCTLNMLQRLNLIYRTLIYSNRIIRLHNYIRRVDEIERSESWK